MEPHRLNAPGRLRAAGLANPLGVATPQPELSWQSAGADVDAYLVEVTVAGEQRDAKTTASTLRLPWPGPGLASYEEAVWRVGAQRGSSTTWSARATIEAPPWSLDTSSFITHPQWLPGSPMPAAVPEFRATFDVASLPPRARLAVATPGVVVGWLNGHRIGEEHLAPGYAELGSQTPALLWDVTALLLDGRNELTLVVGTGIGYIPSIAGRYAKFVTVANPPALLAQLTTFDGAATRSISTDTTWETRLSRYALTHWYGGEDHRLDAGPWVTAVPARRDQPLRWRGAPPIRVTETLAPTHSYELSSGAQIVDFGTNSAGRPVLAVADLARGTTVTLHPAELLTPDGDIDQASTGTPIFDSVTASGEGDHVAPEFVYHGARYLRVDGHPVPVADAITMQVLRTANERVGTFSTSDPFLARLHTMIDRAVQSNMFSVFTDCPHREKLGWLEELYLCFDTLALSWDVEAHLSDTVEHLTHAQQPSGLIPSTVPELVVFNTYPWKGDRDAFRDDPNWGRAIIELPWSLYRHYGTTAPLRRAYPAMLRYLAHLESRAVDGLLDHGLGDWIELDDSTPRSLVATHGYATSTLTASRVAEVLGEQSAALELRARGQAAWNAITSAFLGPDGCWGSGSQASWALGWSHPFATRDAQERAFAGLLRAIDAADGAVTVGEIALPWLIRAMTDHDHAAQLLTMMSRTDAAGYGLQVAAGATALTESWRGPGGEDGVDSQNHFMLGAIDAWLINDIAGLRQSAHSVAWSHVEVAPTPLPGVDRVAAEFESPQGRFAVAWEREGPDGGGVVRATVPDQVAVEWRIPSGWRLERG